MDKNRWKKLLLGLLYALPVVCACVTVWALFFYRPSRLPPDYAPGETEPYGQEIVEPSGEKLEGPAGGGAASLQYGDQVTVVPAENLAKLYFANPSRSSQDVVLQIVVQDTLLCQSGRLIPGTMVTQLELEPGVAQRLSQGGYQGKLLVHFYDPVTRERAYLNTQIPLWITVE